MMRLLHSEGHIGTTNFNKPMERYIDHVTPEGVTIFKCEETYAKIKLAAKIIAGQPNLEDVIVVSSRDLGQRAVIKFATYTGCTATSADRKAIIEASYMNIPVIALVNANSSLQYVDVAIPGNNKSTSSISMIFWLLAREVRILNGQLNREDDW